MSKGKHGKTDETHDNQATYGRLLAVQKQLDSANKRVAKLETVIQNAINEMKTGYPEQWDFTELKALEQL